MNKSASKLKILQNRYQQLVQCARLIILIFVAACSNSTPHVQPVINRDNYIEILLQTFEVYSGHAYDDRLRSFPYVLLQSSSEAPADCINGGVLTQITEFTQFGENTRESTFNNCQIGTDTVNGHVINNFNPIVDRHNFTDFTVTFEPQGQMRINGQYWTCCPIPFSQLSSFPSLVSTENLDYFFTFSGGTLTVENAITFMDSQIFYATMDRASVSGVMRGGFVMKSPLSGGQHIEANILSEFTYDSVDALSIAELEELDTTWTYSSGTLHLKADDGSELTINADTGDRLTVAITLNNVNGIESFVEEWSLWRDAFISAI